MLISGLKGLNDVIHFLTVTKTNLAVHEDKNRVPYVKVRKGFISISLNCSKRWKAKLYKIFMLDIIFEQRKI